MSLIFPAIVVAGFNRPKSLRRILHSIGTSYFPQNKKVDLVISVDCGSDTQSMVVAKAFDWIFGGKRIIQQKEHLGLRRHVLFCGDLTKEYSSTIQLEDDLLVSPYFYDFSCKALTHYANEPRIAGISLYSFGYQEFSASPFAAIDDGYDNYFLKSASSSGQAWTWAQWSLFRSWYDRNNTPDSISNQLPQDMIAWPESSWKKYFNSYLVDTARYFVVPRNSWTTNMGEAGTHFRRRVTRITVPLSMGRRRHSFAPFTESYSKYDAFFELEADCLHRLVPSLAQYSLSVDLYGTKSNNQISTPYVLTSRPTEKTELSFGLRFLPPELNIILSQSGKFFALAETSSARSVCAHKASKLRYFFR
jgi:hypothetical protein